MADRRERKERRRQLTGSESDDEIEKSRVDNTRARRRAKSSDCDSEGDDEDDYSEYESAEDDDDEEYEEKGESEDLADYGDEDLEAYLFPADHDGDYADEEAEGKSSHFEESERQSGDGEEAPGGEKALDGDEDRQNPAYVPKKGIFYEHDTRTGDPKEAERKREKVKKLQKLWHEDTKWSHDMFRVEEQCPKSREELVAVYGYDIRDPDSDRRRRRRKYTRGQGKYERDWKDVDAYQRPPSKLTLGSYVRGGGRGRGRMRAGRPGRGARYPSDQHRGPRNFNRRNVSDGERVAYEPVAATVRDTQPRPTDDVIVEQQDVIVETEQHDTPPRHRHRSPPHRHGDHVQQTSKKDSLTEDLENLNITVTQDDGGGDSRIVETMRHPKRRDGGANRGRNEDRARKPRYRRISDERGQGDRAARYESQQANLPPRFAKQEGRGAKRYSSQRQRGVPDDSHMSYPAPEVTKEPSNKFYEHRVSYRPEYETTETARTRTTVPNQNVQFQQQQHMMSHYSHDINVNISPQAMRSGPPPPHVQTSPSTHISFPPPPHVPSASAPSTVAPGLKHPNIQVPPGPPPYYGPGRPTPAPLVNYGATPSFPPTPPQIPPGPPVGIRPIPPPYPASTAIPQQQNFSAHSASEGVFRDGVAYYSPEAQQSATMKTRSPARRPKLAIPIVPPPEPKEHTGGLQAARKEIQAATEHASDIGDTSATRISEHAHEYESVEEETEPELSEPAVLSEKVVEEDVQGHGVDSQAQGRDDDSHSPLSYDDRKLQQKDNILEETDIVDRIDAAENALTSGEVSDVSRTQDSNTMSEEPDNINRTQVVSNSPRNDVDGVNEFESAGEENVIKSDLLQPTHDEDDSHVDEDDEVVDIKDDISDALVTDDKKRTVAAAECIKISERNDLEQTKVAESDDIVTQADADVCESQAAISNETSGQLTDERVTHIDRDDYADDENRDSAGQADDGTEAAQVNKVETAATNDGNLVVIDDADVLPESVECSTSACPDDEREKVAASHTADSEAHNASDEEKMLLREQMQHPACVPSDRSGDWNDSQLDTEKLGDVNYHCSVNVDNDQRNEKDNGLGDSSAAVATNPDE